MINPYVETYQALWLALATAPELAGIAVFDEFPLDDIERAGMKRRALDEGDELHFALEPQGGNVVQLDSTNAEIRESYKLSAVKGSITLTALWNVKWALLKIFWRKQSLDLDYVSGLSVRVMRDEPLIGTGAVGAGDVPSASWDFSVLIEVTMLLSSTVLPKG